MNVGVPSAVAARRPAPAQVFVNPTGALTPLLDLLNFVFYVARLILILLTV